jgi:DNA-binding response OmpR family regulator
MSKILVVEDDKNLSTVLSMQLQHEGHVVEAAYDGNGAMRKLSDGSYELVILDWLLPDIPGIDICKLYRQKRGPTPILMLTCRSSAEDRTAGLDAGADDYMVKPFYPPELGARVRALLRRPRAAPESVLRCGQVELDTVSRRVHVSGQEIDLCPKEFGMLETFLRHPAQSFTAEVLLERLWKSETSSSAETVRTHIKTLRQKLAAAGAGSLIRTRRGVGYGVSAAA